MAINPGNSQPDSNIQPKDISDELEINPFNPAALTLSQDFHKTVGVKKALMTIPVRKPGRQDFVRVHPDDSYRLETAVIELQDDREIYLVDRELWSELSCEIIPKALYTYMNRQNVLAIWPIRMPGDDGRHDPWNASALEAAEMGKDKWIRVSANMSLGAYDVFEATGSFPEPAWPDIDFQKILNIAFKGHYINSLDHPAIRRLRGEI